MSPGRWTVVAVNDDGRSFVVNRGMCFETADELAGVMRDLSIEPEIEDGWNYIARMAPKPVGFKADIARIEWMSARAKQARVNQIEAQFKKHRAIASAKARSRKLRGQAG